MNVLGGIMNIFVLSKDPVEAAEMQCDKHVVKMVLETAQMLCAAFPKGTAPYKQTHINHPCTVWSRQSKANYEWLISHGYALSDEYTSRYGRQHKSLAAIKWCKDNINSLTFPEQQQTDFAQCVPDIYKSNDIVETYREYYKNEKSAIAKWNKNRETPTWFSK